MFEHNSNYSKEEIQEILEITKKYIREGKYSLSLNRVKNYDFVRKYNLSTKKIIEMLLSLVVEDFCYSVPDENSNNENEILYVFGLGKALGGLSGELEPVVIYIKFKIYEIYCEHVVVISFHEAEHRLKFAFD